MEPDDGADGIARSIRLTPASGMAVRPVRWLWQDRLALGHISLLAGREGIGKSTVGYQLAADVTRGHLPGAHFNEPRRVLVSAAEDSWEHTIVPRLMAAGADLDLVYRVDVLRSGLIPTDLVLPLDLRRLEQEAQSVAAVLLLMDPLMSRLDAKIDTHKDADVRLALEPLGRVAETTGMAVLGVIHLNKSRPPTPLAWSWAPVPSQPSPARCCSPSPTPTTTPSVSSVNPRTTSAAPTCRLSCSASSPRRSPTPTRGPSPPGASSGPARAPAPSSTPSKPAAAAPRPAPPPRRPPTGWSTT